MKTIILAIFITFIVSNLHSQPKEYPNPELLKQNRIRLIMIFYYDGVDGIPFSYQEYNSDGNVIERNKYFPEPANYKYIYQDNKLVEERGYDYTLKYYYLDNGNVDYIIVNDEQGEYYTKVNYIYDSAGRILTRKSINDEPFDEFYQSYEYNSYGDLEKIEGFGMTLTYEYDDNKRIKKKKTIVDGAKDWEVEEQFVYDRNNNVSEILEFKYNVSGELTSKYVIELIYNSNGLLSEKKKYLLYTINPFYQKGEIVGFNRSEEPEIIYKYFYEYY